MGKIKYDVSDVEVKDNDFDTPIAKGAYRCKINDITEGISEASVRRGTPEDMLTIEYEVTERGDWTGRRIWDYIVLSEAQEWKLAQFIKANALKAKGQFDPQSLLGNRVLVRVKHEADTREEVKAANGGNPVIRARVGSVNPIPSDADDDEPGEGDEPAAAAAGDDDEEYTYDEIAAMDKDELAEVVDEYELEIDADQDVEELRAEVLEELELEAPAGNDGDGDDGTEEDLTYEDIQDYDKDDLTTLIEEEGLDVTHTKRTKVDVLRERVAEALDLEPDDGEGGTEPDEPVDWNAQNVADLRTELGSRGLSTKGKKTLLVKRLTKDDSDGSRTF